MEVIIEPASHRVVVRIKWVNKDKYMELALSKYQLLLLLQVTSAVRGLWEPRVGVLTQPGGSREGFLKEAMLVGILGSSS